MLVLSRGRKEKIVCSVAGHTIVIHVVRIGRGSVRIGVEADKDVDIVRAEMMSTESDVEDLGSSVVAQTERE